MIDVKAFRSISYGLYLIASHTEDRSAGCVVNTFGQVTSEPLQVSVTLNKENHTTKVIMASGRYTAVCLSEDASMELIGMFGFKRSKEVNKFEAFCVEKDSQGIPYVAEQTLARFSVRVTGSLDLGTHRMFIGTVEEAEVLAQGRPMTYALYHEVKGGKTPSRASSYIAELEDGAVAAPADPAASTGPAASASPATSSDPAAPAASEQGLTHAWRCTICGHTEYVDVLPDDFVCPVCGFGPEKFERIEL